MIRLEKVLRSKFFKRGGNKRMLKAILKVEAVLLIICLVVSYLSSPVLSQTTATKYSKLGQYTTLREYEMLAGKKVSKFNEAPMLAELVKQGKLPPVEKRLPNEPVVVEPIEEIGQYGGTVRMAYIEAKNWPGVSAMTGVETILKFGRDGRTVVPNIAKSWKLSQDGKTLVLSLRKGLKWSDGNPFTADDILFWYEDVFLNEELTPTKPKIWCPGGKPMEMKKLNDYTVQLKFAVSYPIILNLLVYSGTEGSFYLPKHYLKQFHIRYTPKEKLMEIAKQEGYNNWSQLFLAKSSCSFLDPTITLNFPTLCAFVIQSRGLNQTTLVRNPYYWKIDPDGNQLPYIDRIQASLVENLEIYNMKIINGEVDFAAAHTGLENYPLYKENEDKGNYRVFLWKLGHSSVVTFHINLTHQDPVLRKIFNDRRFRIALSLAINREELNQVACLGKGVPKQVSVLPPSKYYFEEYAKAYTQYDLKEANKLLDEMGLDKRDKDGYRLRPDGKTLAVTIEYTPASVGPTKVTIVEMVQKYWEKLGIKVAVKQEDRQLYMVRCRTGNQHDIGLWHADMLTEPLWPTGAYVFPISVMAEWAPLWYLWFTSDGKTGEEPPEEIKRIMKLYETIQTSMKESEKIRAAREIWKSNAQNLWAIGTVGLIPHPIIVSKKLHNIPQEGWWAWDYFYAALYSPEQRFLK